MRRPRLTGPHPKALAPTLTRVADLPAPRAAAALLTRALELGIHPTSAAAWTRRQAKARMDLRDLASDSRRWRSLTHEVTRHRRETHDPRKTSEKAVAWMLAPRPEKLTPEQHRHALTVIAAVALRTTGPDAEGWGDACFMGGGDLGVALGISEWAARARLGHAVTLGALDRRSAAPTGVASKLRIVRAPHELWAVTQTEKVAPLVRGLERGERTILDAFTHPAAAEVGLDAILAVMYAEAGVKAVTGALTRSALSRARTTLDKADIDSSEALLDYLDALLDVPDLKGVTPTERRTAAVQKRRDAADARTLEIARFQVAGKAAARVDYASAYAASRKVTPLIVEAIKVHGKPGERAGDELRQWVTAVHTSLAPHNLTPAEEAGAIALLALACTSARRTTEQNTQLARLAVVEGIPA